MSLINQSSTHHLYRKVITLRSNKINALAFSVSAARSGKQLN